MAPLLVDSQSLPKLYRHNFLRMDSIGRSGYQHAEGEPGEVSPERRAGKKRGNGGKGQVLTLSVPQKKTTIQH